MSSIKDCRKFKGVLADKSKSGKMSKLRDKMLDDKERWNERFWMIEWAQEFKYETPRKESG
jgi:hypothetical protein